MDSSCNFLAERAEVKADDDDEAFSNRMVLDNNYDDRSVHNEETMDVESDVIDVLNLSTSAVDSDIGDVIGRDLFGNDDDTRSSVVHWEEVHRPLQWYEREKIFCDL